MSNKINYLLQHWPKNTVATQAFLDRFGISRKLAGWYVKSGWLERVGPRAYSRAGDVVGWQGGVFSLQQALGMTVHVGGRSALDMKGLSHFVPLRSDSVFLVSDVAEALPSWFVKHDWSVRVEHRVFKLFGNPPKNSLQRVDCGGFDVLCAGAERAIMEMIHAAGENEQYDHVCLLMEGLSLLRPDVVQTLLEECRSIKVKRFFLWCAQLAHHDWFKRLDLDRIDLGNGKRQLYRDGVYNSTYRITVPVIEDETDV
ncbi:MAG: hypothetical protein EOM20_00790 [Spartobacteria bacterium]|nr:hypothetical protein [Spartobacteria bacterium]